MPEDKCLKVNDKITITYDENKKDTEIVLDNLFRYNIKKTNDLHTKTDKSINLYLRDEYSNVIGGIFCITYCYCMQINDFWISEKYQKKGYGTILIKEAEKIAKEIGCTFSFTGTFSYQAPEFYEKLGYIKFSKLEDFPEGIVLFFLKKKL